LTAVLLALTFFPAGPRPRAQEENPLAGVDRRILTEIAEHSEQMENLQYLTDRIGPRLTGTEALRRANQWTAQRFRDYGLANVRLEPWTIAYGWKRGTARARVVAPAQLPLEAHAAGWSPNTPGTVRGRLAYVKVENLDDLEAYRGKLRGAIVITRKPRPRQRVKERPLHPRPPRPKRDYAALREFRHERDTFFKEEGVLAVLRDSDKSFGLFHMASASPGFRPAPLPTAYFSPESYDLLWRLHEDGQPVELEFTIEDCQFSDSPVEVYNTVAEIPGTEKPDEAVILAAHLDSWVLATGAGDNGTGVSAVLEAARALRKLDLKPRRTIRFILFSGEEQGLHGSHAYVSAHMHELQRASAVLVHDGGTGRVDTIALQGNAHVYDVLKTALAPLRRMIGLSELNLRSSNGSDHVSFNQAGVPGFFCVQERAAYAQTHHSQADTFDKVVREDLLNGAQVMAVFAYNVAQLDDLLPRRASRQTQ
jgi:hypothetical protein